MRTYKGILIGSCMWLSACMLGRISSELENDAPDHTTHADMHDASTPRDMPADMPPPDVSSPVDMPQPTDAPNPDMDTTPDITPDVPVDMPPANPGGSQGCLTGAGLEAGARTLKVGERDRRYVLRLPENYSRDKPWPLVFALHGNGGDTGYWDTTSGDRNMREVLKDDAILVVAAAIDKKWRDYDAPRDTWPERIEEELDYFDAMLGELRADLCIQQDAIFSMGFSGGGSFSGVLGCRRDDIRAIAVGGSVIYFDSQNCVGTPAAWVTIGVDELNDGRTSYRDFFRDRAGCTASSTATDPDPCQAYDGCGAQTPVHYCQHGGGHVWPSFGAQAAWDFFEQFVE